LRSTIAGVARRYGAIEPQRLVHESLRRLISAMVVDLVGETRRRLERCRPADADAVRALGRPVVAFSDGMALAVQALREFLHVHMYSHDKVRRMALKAQRVVKELFAALLERPECLPPAWQARAGASGSPETAVAIADYVAGMTDRFALDEHARLFTLTSREP